MSFVFVWVESTYDAIKRGLMMRVREKRKKAREREGGRKLSPLFKRDE